MKVKPIGHNTIKSKDKTYRNYQFIVCKTEGLGNLIKLFKSRYKYVYTELSSIDKVKIVTLLV